MSDLPLDFFYLLSLEMEVSSRDMVRLRFNLLVKTFLRWC